MKKRWVAAGMLEAERSFRRVRGHKDMERLVSALRREIGSRGVTQPPSTIRQQPEQAVATAELQQRAGHPLSSLACTRSHNSHRLGPINPTRASRTADPDFDGAGKVTSIQVVSLLVETD